jgi:hypothetical protein
MDESISEVHRGCDIEVTGFGCGTVSEIHRDTYIRLPSRGYSTKNPYDRHRR